MAGSGDHSSPSHSTVAGIHSGFMAVLWLGMVNLSIFLVLYKYRKWYFYLHAIVGGLITIFTLSFSIPLVFELGLSYTTSSWDSHFKLGLAVIVIVGSVGLVGILCRIMQIIPWIGPMSILWAKFVHRWLGYTCWILGFVNCLVIYETGAIIAVLIWQAIFLALVIYRKYKFPLLENIVSPLENKSNQSVKQVTDLHQIDSIADQYVLFSNFAYSVQELKSEHPAGFQIISRLKRREVDRFVYGMFSSEMNPQVSPFSHSFKSFNLLGPPIAKLAIPSPYTNFDTPFSEFRIASKRVISWKGSIYALFLLPTENILEEFKGYTDLHQLGRYYSVTVNDSITRLYTTVNFLQESNMSLLQKIDPEFALIENLKHNGGELFEASNETLKNRVKLPLLIKKYEAGKLTPILIDSEEIKSLKVSSEKGTGLQLATTKPGRIIIIVGGTGLYPFSDFIDLLYKAQLLRNNHPQSGSILNENPLLRSKPFEGYQIELYGAFAQMEDLHPVTYKQIRELCRDPKRFSAIFRCLEAPENKDGITYTKTRFEALLKDTIKGNESRIWVCGPPKMNESIAKLVMDWGGKESQLLIV